MSSLLSLPSSRFRWGWLLFPVLALPIPVGAQTANLSVDATQAMRTVDGRQFGVNAVVWDWNTASSHTVNLIQAAGIGVIRIPGGSASDVYDWSTSRDYVSPGVLDMTWINGSGFDKFSQLITGANTQAFVTVNYGSGTRNRRQHGSPTPTPAPPCRARRPTSHSVSTRTIKIGRLRDTGPACAPPRRSRRTTATISSAWAGRAPSA